MYCVSDSSNSREYCESEAFRARCRGNEIILMESALYGRMRLGQACSFSDRIFMILVLVILQNVNC